MEIPCQFHGPFFRDQFFTNSWKIIERQKQQYEEKYGVESGKYSVQRDLPFRSQIIESPPLADLMKTVYHFKSTTGDENGFLEEPEKEMDIENDLYQVILDIQHFRPNEIKVTKTNDEGGITGFQVEGMHEEQQDPIHHGVVTRQFTRKYKVPVDAKVDEIQANMSADGILQITMPRVGTTCKDTEAEAVEGEEKSKKGFLSKVKNYMVHVLPDFHMTSLAHKLWHPTPVFGVQGDRECFKILVNVKGFEPEDLQVECTDYFVVIAAGHQERNDANGSLERQFKRIYDLPRSVSVEDLQCSLLAGGVLEIMAPRKYSTSDGAAEKLPLVKLNVNVTKEAEEEMNAEEERKRNIDWDTMNFMLM